MDWDSRWAHAHQGDNSTTADTVAMATADFKAWQGYLIVAYHTNHAIVQNRIEFEQSPMDIMIRRYISAIATVRNEPLIYQL